MWYKVHADTYSGWPMWLTHLLCHPKNTDIPNSYG